MAPILLNDTELRFPNFTVISASAGSGKTHTLTLKLLQLLLSDRIQNNRLNNILAMTFTKNAASEMRQRVLEYLKKVYLGNRKLIDQLLPIISVDEERLRAKCGELIDAILHDYSAFQIQTIDSFLTRIFRASALEFGFSPTLEIKLTDHQLLDAAVEQFARELTADSSKRILLEQLTDIIVENQNVSSRYIWNPFEKLSYEIRKLYGNLNAQLKEILPPSEGNQSIRILRSEILETFYQLHGLVSESGLEMMKHFENAVVIAKAKNVEKLIELKGVNKPVKAGKKKAEKEKAEEWNERFAPLLERFNELAKKFIVNQAYSYYHPYVEAHRIFRSTIERHMRRHGQISLSDVSKALLSYVSEENVPQVYFYLGDAIFHYLIDEFQDTAPMQWETMKPLFAEALSKQGSLFVVGDTKQSIYAFRDADWRIMKNVMGSNVFPSAPPNVKELEINYRSSERILDFNKKVFKEIIPNIMEGEAPHASGLSSFKQEAEESKRRKGYVEIVTYEKDAEQEPERVKILKIVNDCRARNYKYGDMTVLTPKNQDVIAVSEWLNSQHIPFVSHSSLDIRGQSITGEIFALLKFLDSPIDNLAFATFLLSGIFHRVLSADGKLLSRKELRTFFIQARRTNRNSPLYILFRAHYADIWKKYFDELFNVVGYLPMYDLASEIYKKFRLFELAPEEEGTLAKFLEVMKNFEQAGQNNLKDFLTSEDEEGDDSEWNIPVPSTLDAVSVMTVHKAKGLDNRVVIVLLVDYKKTPDNLFIEEDEEGVRLVHITQKNAEYDKVLRDLYNERRLKNTVDELNKLYVAFTRAKEEMYVVSVKGDRIEEPSKFLPQSGYESSVKPSVDKQEEQSEMKAELYHSSIRLPMEFVSPERLALYERRRGETIHNVLSRIRFIDADMEVYISTALQEIAGSWLEPADAVRMTSQVKEFLHMPEMMPYFVEKTDRIILNEQDFVGPEGRLFRMDRIVIDADTVTVLDFKTGNEKDEHSEQVLGYMAMLKDYYSNRIVHGVLAYVDKKIIRVIT